MSEDKLEFLTCCDGFSYAPTIQYTSRAASAGQTHFTGYNGYVTGASYATGSLSATIDRDGGHFGYVINVSSLVSFPIRTTIDGVTTPDEPLGIQSSSSTYTGSALGPGGQNCGHSVSANGYYSPLSSPTVYTGCGTFGTHNFNTWLISNDTARNFVYTGSSTGRTHSGGYTMSDPIVGSDILSAASTGLTSATWDNVATSEVAGSATLTNYYSFITDGLGEVTSVDRSERRIRLGYSRSGDGAGLSWLKVDYEVLKDYDGVTTFHSSGSMEWAGDGSEAETSDSNWSDWINGINPPSVAGNMTTAQEAEAEGTNYTFVLLRYKNYHSGPWVKVNDPIS